MEVLKKENNIIRFPLSNYHAESSNDSKVVDLLLASLNNGELVDSEEVNRLKGIFFAAFSSYKKLYGDLDITDFEIVTEFSVEDDCMVKVKYNFKVREKNE